MITVISYPDNQINYNINEGDSLNSLELVKYLFIDVSEALTDQYIEITYNGVTTTLLIEDECKHSPIDIFYQNKEGALSSLTFFKKRVESIEAKNEMFESDRGQPLDGNHQMVTYNVQANEKFTANTGFIDEEQNECIRELLLSERVWRYENNIYVPVRVASRSIEYKTQNNDKLLNYAISFEYAYNLINNI